MANAEINRVDPEEIATSDPEIPETPVDVEGTTDADADADTDTDTDAQSRTLAKDDVFHVLQNERRRLVLRCLAGVEGPVQMRDIADQVTAWENDTSVSQITSDQRQRVYIALYQSHLPKLDKLGLINYNQSRGIVEPRKLTEEATIYLNLDDDDEATDAEEQSLPWLQAYLGAAAVSIGLVGGLLVGAAPLVALGPLAVAVVVTSLFTALTTALAFKHTA